MKKQWNRLPLLFFVYPHGQDKPERNRYVDSLAKITEKLEPRNEKPFKPFFKCIDFLKIIKY
ncbi:MAG: hypothetical protein JEZ12_10760 [Desulfobacterium sp.]|nr:hypothetical protein [Desulfobacterium sp.]